MTEDIIKSITQAESQASQIKKEAQEKATAIVAGATSRASEIETAGAQLCKSYRETQIKKAQENAEKEYQTSIRVKTEEAKAYCEDSLKNAEASIGKIVGRIVSGNR